MAVEPSEQPVAPQQEASYEDRMRRIMSRLRSGDYFSLTDGEVAEITILSDIDDWVELSLHKDKEGNYVCPKMLNQDCPDCFEGKTVRLGLGLSILNRTNGMTQVVFWTMHKNSPLNDIEDTYKFEKVPVRGMRFRIIRHGTQRDTVYKLAYQRHHTDFPDLPPLPAPVPREVVIEVVAAVLARKEKDAKGDKE